MSTPTPDLGTIITSPKIRKAIYGVYVIAIVIAGAMQVAFSAIQADQPSWLIAAVAVLAYLGIPVGGLALANTGTTTPTAGE